jgi:thiol-disulfide isomerase/thioredoxin
MMRPLLLVFGLGFATIAAADPATDGSAAPPPTPTESSPGASDLWTKIGSDGQQITQAEHGSDPAAMTAAVAQIQTDLASYLQQYPSGAHLPEAKLMSARADQLAIELKLPGAPTSESVNQRFDALATDSSLPMNVRVQAAMAIAQQIFAGAMETARTNPHDPQMWDDLDAKIDAFAKKAGPGPGQEPEQAVLVLRENQMMFLQHSGETERLQKLLAKLETSPIPQLAALAKQAEVQAQQAAELKSKPLDLKFTALDGTAIDLAKMRGKVVLVDFWATWCPPCRAEMPDVVAAYQKYHAQGFEVVGISLDQDKAALQKYITDNQMPWPQYFDGKGWDSLIGRQFGIDSIPAMWLVGKDGIVVTMDARDHLADQIGKELAKP